MGCSNSGKSHTLFGNASNDMGLLQMFLNRLFILVDYYNNQDEDERTSVSLSAVEFYSEHAVLDLLRPDARTQLTVRRSKEMKRSYVEGLSHHSVFSSKNAIRLLKEALQVRALGISNRNIQRGDSSLVINVSLHRYSKESGDVLSMWRFVIH